MLQKWHVSLPSLTSGNSCEWWNRIVKTADIITNLFLALSDPHGLLMPRFSRTTQICQRSCHALPGGPWKWNKGKLSVQQQEMEILGWLLDVNCQRDEAHSVRRYCPCKTLENLPVNLCSRLKSSLFLSTFHVLTLGLAWLGLLPCLVFFASCNVKKLHFCYFKVLFPFSIMSHDSPDQKKLLEK